MGSLRHGKMEQAGARNGLKQTRISSKAPLTQTTYGKKEFTAEGCLLYTSPSPRD